MIPAIRNSTSLKPQAPPDAPAGALGTLRKLGRAIGATPADRSVLGALGRLGRQQDERLAPSPRQAAELMVSQLFYQPLLAEARQSPFQTEIGSGGRGEEVFGEQLDLLLADRMSAAAQGGLIEQLAERFEARGGRSTPTSGAAAASRTNPVDTYA